MKSSLRTRIIAILAAIFWRVPPALPAEPGDVVINEIAWAGTLSSANDEWIELYNTTTGNMDITGWTLSAADGGPAIALSGAISSKGYFLLERTDDQTIVDVEASQIYSGSIGNTGEHFLLQDVSLKIIDDVDCSGGWFGGDNASKSSMERIMPSAPGSGASNWTTNSGVVRNGTDGGGNPVNGTPKAANSCFDASLSVHLTGFRASYTQSRIHICWSTASEVNSLGFWISRAAAEPGPYHKVNLDIIQSGGNTSSARNYSFDDYNWPEWNEIWYRLEEEDTSGRRTILGALPVRIEKEQDSGKEVLFNVFPNPFNPNTNFSLNIPSRYREEKVELCVFNMMGEKVKTLISAAFRIGSQTLAWSGRDDRDMDLPSGCYVARLRIGDENFGAQKLMKME